MLQNLILVFIIFLLSTLDLFPRQPWGTGFHGPIGRSKIRVCVTASPIASLRQVKTRISVLVVDVPSEPRNVRIAEHTPNSALLEWEPPDDNGGVELIGSVRSPKMFAKNVRQTIRCSLKQNLRVSNREKRFKIWPMVRRVWSCTTLQLCY